MLKKTRGIVLHAIAYNDNYSIIHVYTEEFGRASYLVPRKQGKKHALSKALFIPLSVIEMDVEHRNKRDLHRIKESRMCFPQTEIYCNPLKNTLALFLAEMLYRVVKETEPDPPLFEFLYSSVQFLEIADEGIANFHIVFLLRLLTYLGIFPNAEFSRTTSYFDLLNGIFVPSVPLHRHFLNKEDSETFGRLLRIRFENMSLYAFSRHERVAIINRIIEYYRLHIPEFPEIKSVSILQSLFD